jgi:hypothetical protein
MTMTPAHAADMPSHNQGRAFRRRVRHVVPPVALVVVEFMSSPNSAEYETFI